MGGKTSTTTQGVSVPQEVLDRYKSINTRAENVAGTPFQTYSEDPSKFVAQVTQQQQQGINNVNASAGAYRPYFDQAASTFSQGMQPAQPGALNTEQYMNPFQQQVIDATMRQMGQANQQAQSGALGTAIQSGAFGGDRAGIAAANLANQQGLAMGSTLAGLNAQNYGQALQTAQQQQGVNLGATQADLARLMQGGQFYAGLGQAAQQAGLQGAEAQINAGTLGQQTEQAGLSALYNQFQQKQAYPFQVAQFLANIGMGTGALSGSTTTTTQPGSFFSDRRLKEDVQRIGEGDNGLPIYKYRYKGEPDTHIGFMADEVEQVRPEAVGLHPTGYKTVDYDRATKAGGGGVAGPYGSAAGSQPSGVAGYVPEAYLPVGDLMMADPGALQQARQSFAQQLEAAANFGNSIKDLEGNWQWAKDTWGGKEREQAVDDAERARGVSGYASGGPAYLNAGLRPGDTTNDRRTYLSDTLEAQSDQDKRRDGLAGPGSAPQARTTGQDMADIAKVAMAFMGMNRGGRTGYADGGFRDDETTGEKVARFTYPARDLAFRRVPEAVASIGTAGLGASSNVAGLAAGTLGMPNAADLMFKTADRFYGMNRNFSDSANSSARPYDAPPASDLSAADIRALGQSPEQMAQIDAMSRDPRTGMTRIPTAGTGLVPDRSYVEYTQMLNDPRGAAVPSRPLPSETVGVGGGGADRMPAPLSYGLGSPGIEDAALSMGSLRPRPRPAGLVPGPGMEELAATGITGGAAPAPTSAPAPIGAALAAEAPPAPGGATGAGVSGMNPTDFFYTNIVRQESGGKQFDPKTGLPLTSSAGAVGAAQVMEGTGPEAAALAGMEWDRDRWLNDKDYNLKLGEAYFLEQYRRYGSLDKAAAAYNAGPGALESAMDRATALGGSYLDYLPAETQNYVASTVGGTGVSGGAAPRADRTSGQETDITSAPAGLKPYDERNMLGQMMYDPETNKLSRNALLSLASGVGSMLASPSQYFLPSLGLGLQGAASTYAGLEKQAADVGLTKAQQAETQVRTDASRFFTVGPNGMPMVVLGPNQTVTLSEYLQNPQMFSTGNPELDAKIEGEARRRSANGVGGMQPTTAAGDVAPTGVRWGQASQDALARANQAVKTQSGSMNFTTNSQAVNELVNGATTESTEAVLAKPNSNELAYTVAGAIGAGDMGSVQGYLANSVVSPLNAVLRQIGVEPFLDTDDRATILRKLGSLNAASLTPEQQRAASVYQQFVDVSPDLTMTPEAAAAITSSLMLTNQQAIDRANYYQAFQGAAAAGFPPNYMTQGYAGDYSGMHQIEKGNLNDLFLMAGDPAKGETVKKFLSAANSGLLTQEKAQEILNYILGPQNTSQALARYFITGM